MKERVRERVKEREREGKRGERVRNTAKHFL